MSQVGLDFLPSFPVSASRLLASDDIKERFRSPSAVTFGIKFLSVRVSFLTSAPQLRLSVNEISPYFEGIPALFRRGADFFPPVFLLMCRGGMARAHMQSVPLHRRHETVQLFNSAPSRKYKRSLHLLLVAHQWGGVNSKSTQKFVYILVLRSYYFHIIVFNANVSY